MDYYASGRGFPEKHMARGGVLRGKSRDHPAQKRRHTTGRTREVPTI